GVTNSLINNLFASPSHKPSKGGGFRVDTTLEGVSITSETPAGNGSPFSFTIGPTEQIVLSNLYNTKHNTKNWVGLGMPALTTQGYGVQSYPVGGGSPTDIVPRTLPSVIPTEQWIKTTSGTKKVLFSGRYFPYFFPDGLTFDASNGAFTYDTFLTKSPFTNSGFIPYRMNRTRDAFIDFNPSGNSGDIVKRLTNKLIFIPTDKSVYGKADAFYSASFDSIPHSSIQQFYDQADTPLTGNMCANPSNVKVDFEIIITNPSGATGGGFSNNEEWGIPQETFTAGNRFAYANMEQIARYRADVDMRYLDDKTFSYSGNYTQMKTDFAKLPTNNSQINSLFPGWSIAGSDEAHNWAFQTNLNFYHYTGEEVYRRGSEASVIWWWLNGFQWVNYARPMGMFLQAQAHALQFFHETADSRYSSHESFVTNFLNTGFLYIQSIPSYGYYPTWQGKNPAIVCNFDDPSTTKAETNLCFGFYSVGKGWWADPGQKIDVSTLAPEIQALDLKIDTFYQSDGAENCQTGSRWWMHTNRIALAIFELFHTYSALEPSKATLINDLSLRAVDMAKMLAGNEVGGGEYYNNFTDPKKSNGWYQFCPLEPQLSVAGDPSSAGTGNGYIASHIYTYAAELATTNAEKAWWHHMALNELFSIHYNAYSGGAGFTCYKEFDPRAQDSIKGYLDWGGDYTPGNYGVGTPYPDPSATFSLSSVVPSTANKGFDIPITLNGSLFTNTDKVEIGNPTLLTITPTFVDSGKLTFTLTASQSNTLGTGTFVVRVKQGSTYSNAKNLTIQLLNPTLASISPSAINSGSSSQLFSLVGTNFQNGGQVKVGTLAPINATISSSTNATFTLSTATISTLGVGVFDVSFQNLDGGVSPPQTLSILAPGSPILDTYSPIDVEWNTGPTTITLTGSNFQ
ncbi:MAG: hypothetical protein AABX02_05310, partial [archaeon]